MLQPTAPFASFLPPQKDARAEGGSMPHSGRQMPVSAAVLQKCRHRDPKSRDERNPDDSNTYPWERPQKLVHPALGIPHCCQEGWGQVDTKLSRTLSEIAKDPTCHVSKVEPHVPNTSEFTSCLGQKHRIHLVITILLHSSYPGSHSIF